MSNYKIEKILDVPVDLLSMSDIKKDLDSYFSQGKKMTLTSVNPQIILMAEENPIVKAFIETSTHRIADGIGLVKVSKWSKGDITERVAGFDAMQEVLSYANDHKKRIFLFGAAPEVVQVAAQHIQVAFPELVLAGWLDGYTKLKDNEIVKRMNESSADVIFVAMGSPKQEEWLSRNISFINSTVFQTVGGSLDVISGTAKRAPDLFIKLNLEWLYRSVSNPKRFYRIFQLPVFVIKSMSWARKNKKQ